MLCGMKDLAYGQAVLMLKQAKERIQSISGISYITTKTVIVAQNKANKALLVTKSHPQSMLASRPS